MANEKWVIRRWMFPFGFEYLYYYPALKYATFNIKSTNSECYYMCDSKEDALKSLKIFKLQKEVQKAKYKPLEIYKI